jgi:hypothetical protein
VIHPKSVLSPLQGRAAELRNDHRSLGSIKGGDRSGIHAIALCWAPTWTSERSMASDPSEIRAIALHRAPSRIW